MKRRPPRSPLFPYTTLFRSASLKCHTNGRSGKACRTAWANGTARQFSCAHTTSGASARTPSRQQSRRSEEHTSELQSRQYLVCRLLLEKKIQKRHYLVCRLR